jgi:hypothetical protein
VERSFKSFIQVQHGGNMRAKGSLVPSDMDVWGSAESLLARLKLA